MTKVPIEVMRATLKAIATYIKNYRPQNGAPGLRAQLDVIAEIATAGLEAAEQGPQ